MQSFLHQLFSIVSPNIQATDQDNNHISDVFDNIRS